MTGRSWCLANFLLRQEMEVSVGDDLLWSNQDEPCLLKFSLPPIKFLWLKNKLHVMEFKVS